MGPLALVTGQAAAMFVLSQHVGLWPWAVLLVLVVEWWGLQPGGSISAGKRRERFLERMPAVIMGLSTVLVIAVSPRLATQIVTVSLFVLWRVWWRGERIASGAALANLLLVQAGMFEALFLMAAIWRPANWLVLVLVWLGAYGSVYAVLSRRGERAAGVMAAAWAVIAVEVSWVLQLWLFTYTMSGGYILVPQPALILTALAYCFGSVYASQREGNLSRGRLTEYLIIALILIVIVVLGTSWRGSV